MLFPHATQLPPYPVSENPPTPYIHQQLGLIPSCHSPTLPFLTSCHAVLSLGVLKYFLTLRETTSLSLLILLIV